MFLYTLIMSSTCYLLSTNENLIAGCSVSWPVQLVSAKAFFFTVFLLDLAIFLWLERLAAAPKDNKKPYTLYIIIIIYILYALLGFSIYV